MPAEKTVTCPHCGATGQAEAFCDSCGALLPVVSSPAASSAAASPPAASSAAASPPAASSAAASPPADTDVRLRARPLVVPVADPVRAGQVTPVPPGVPEPAVPAVRGPDTGDTVTGPPCPWCSTPNPLDRHFCRRCAMLLALRPDPEHLPWWRRMLQWCRRFGWRYRELPYAGQRPRLHRGSGRLARWLVFAVVVGLVAFAADTWAGAAVTNVKDHFAHPTIVFASSVTASQSDPHHPIANIHDGFNNTFWGTGETGDGAGVQVNATFPGPTDLLDIVITPGAGVSQDTFISESRPQTIGVTLTSADGSSTSTTLTLPDSPGPDTFAIHGSDITTIRFTIESAYPASAGSNTEVAIAEIEFFASSGGG